VNLTTKRMNEVSLQTLHDAWIRGFEGYFFDMNVPVERLAAKFFTERLSARHSFVLFDGNLPVGFVFNGFRQFGDKKMAWNGGTGVHIDYRGKGLGRKLMEEAFRIYREEGVDLATLEVVDRNTAAKTLYEKFGYREVDLLRTYELDMSYEGLFAGSKPGRYGIRRGQPAEAGALPFYQDAAPWQYQWMHMINAESVLVLDERGETVGYALARRLFGEKGELQTIMILQAHAQPGHPDPRDVIRAALHGACGPFAAPCKIIASLPPASNVHLIDVLKEEGFRATDIALYNMWHEMK